VSTDDAVGLLRTLVAFDTVSVRSNLELVGWVADLLDAVGADVRHIYDPTGRKANLLATVGPESAGGIVLSAHTDVVPVEGQRWSADPFTLVEREDRLHGRGTADMKGFLAACLAVLPRASRLRRPVHLALSYDEEAGCLGVPALVDELVRAGPRPACAIVGEPTGMRIATATAATSASGPPSSAGRCTPATPRRGSTRSAPRRAS
jgi:acetylornithine deacetylase